MKRRFLATALTFAVVALAAVAGASSASAGSPVTVSPYSAGPYPFLGVPGQDEWTCNGVRITHGASAEDEFTCTVVNPTFSGTFTEGIPWPCGCTGWVSDYDGAVAQAYVVRVYDNGTVVGTARY